MALIKCPECGKEISDKAESCPNCGCPINLSDDKKEQTIVKTKKSLGKIIIPIVIGIVAIVGLGCGIYYKKVIIPRHIEEENRATFEQATSFLEKGKYDEGIELLHSIEDYENVDIILEEAKYESYAYSAVNAVKSVLKNPDSISVYEIHFYDNSTKDDDIDEEDSGAEASENGKEDASKNVDEKYPYIVLHIGAQNGFGGNTTSYTSCSYDSEENQYVLDGWTNELDTDKLDEDDDEYFFYFLSAKIINGYLENGTEVGKIDDERFNNVLRNAAYSSIKIID